MVTHAMKNRLFTAKPRTITDNDLSGAVAHTRRIDTQEAAVVATGAATPSKTSVPWPNPAHTTPVASATPIAVHSGRSIHRGRQVDFTIA
jgi:hypothetical protein